VANRNNHSSVLLVGNSDEIWKHTISSAFSRICELVGAIISDKVGDNH
jgi:hypothetical protein